MANNVNKITGFIEFDALSTPPANAPSGKARQYLDSGTNTIMISTNGGGFSPGGGGAINPTTSIITIGSSLGAVPQLVGPSDQPFTLTTQSNKNLVLAPNGTGEVHVTTPQLAVNSGLFNVSTSLPYVSMATNNGAGTTPSFQITDTSTGIAEGFWLSIKPSSSGIGTMRIIEDGDVTKSMNMLYITSTWAGSAFFGGSTGYLVSGPSATGGWAIATLANAPIIFGTGGQAVANERLRILGNSNTMQFNGGGTIQTTGNSNLVFNAGSGLLDTTASQIKLIAGATGAGAALLASNCPAIDPTTPYTWLRVTASDGSQVYVPAWK